MPGIVRLAGDAPVRQTLAPQDCVGASLSDNLRPGPMELNALLAPALQLVRAVAAMHRAGIIHRASYPANILLGEGGDAVVIDFDPSMLAKPLDAVAELRKAFLRRWAATRRS